MCTQHSTAEHTSTPQHNTIALVRDRATATQQRGARHWSAAPHRTQQQARADGAPATPIGAVPRNLRKRRGLQRPRPRANKGGPRLLSFIYLFPSGCGDLKLLISHAARAQKHEEHRQRCSPDSSVSHLRQLARRCARFRVLVARAPAQCAHTAISSHSA